MKFTRRQVPRILTGAVLVLAWGCGDGTPSVSSSTAEATVTGTVKVKGKAVTKGDIVFNAGNINRKVESRKAAIGPDGSYTIKAYVGENDVQVQANEVMKYHLESEKLGYTVTSGSNTYDIDLGSGSGPTP